MNVSGYFKKLKNPHYSTFSNEELNCPRKTYIPVRYIFGMMAMLGMTVSYLVRNSLNIAIIKMVLPNETMDETMRSKNSSFEYHDHMFHKRAIEYEKDQFDWDAKTQGIILSAFYYGYIVTHIPGGILAEKYGGKHVFGLGIFSSTILTLLTPAVTYLGAFPLMILRFFVGIVQGVTFPAISTMLSQWAPPSERNTLSTATFTGVFAGIILANLCGGYLLQYTQGGWKSIFYIFGCSGLIWYIFWNFLCYNDPMNHPFISEKEKIFLKESIGTIVRRKDLKTPWKSIFTSLPVWALIITGMGHDWAFFVMITEFPKYLSDVLKFYPAQSGFWSALPYMATYIISLLSSMLADWVFKNNYLSTTAVRKIFATVAAIGPAIGVLIGSYAGYNKLIVTSSFTIGIGLMGTFYSSVRLNALDLSPNYSGTLMALSNGSGSLSGMIGPVITGLLTPNKTLSEWHLVFSIMAAILIVTNFTFLLFGSAEVQDWNESTDNKTDSGDSHFHEIKN